MTLDIVAPAELGFVDLVLADEDLLRSEFEAIIAAGWPAPPDAPVPTGADADLPQGEERGSLLTPRSPRVGSTGCRVGSPPLRQRSPPGFPGGEPAFEPAMPASVIDLQGQCP